MKRRFKGMTVPFVILAIMCLVLSGCGASSAKGPTEQPAEEAAVTDENSGTGKDSEEGKPSGDGEDFTEGFGDTFSGDTKSPEDEEEEDDDEEEEETPNMDVDLIFFMGQSNMSGAGGDASAAPKVSEDAGEEFRAESDPTRLYPITEPFGINENDPAGLSEYPGAKKGSMVSAFVNEYHKISGRKVIAVSISMGATDVAKWESDGVRADVKKRFDNAVSYLKNCGYNIGHIYVLWLHGESDAIEGTDPEAYRTAVDNIMRPMFIGGLQKVFIITPGRTIDYKDIFKDIRDMQKKMCAESAYYAIATTVLSKVSAEYMKDQYHYNQHVLNMVGIEAARAVAYYTMHNEEKIVYDYENGKTIVPEGVDEDDQVLEERIHFTDLDINAVY